MARISAAIALCLALGLTSGDARAQTPPPPPVAPADTLAQMRATARYASLDEWNRIRRALRAVNGVDDVRIDAIAVDGALLLIEYRGGQANLEAELARRGLELTIERIGPVLRLARRG